MPNTQTATELSINIDRFARLQEVESITGLKRSMIYKLIARGEFPKPRKLTSSARSGGASGWRMSEIAGWVNTRPLAA